MLAGMHVASLFCINDAMSLTLNRNGPASALWNGALCFRAPIETTFVNGLISFFTENEIRCENRHPVSLGTKKGYKGERERERERERKEE